MSIFTSSKTNLSSSPLKTDNLKTSFFKKGLAVGLISGVFYGLHSAFITFAMTKGIWASWSGDSHLPFLIKLYFLGALASVLNDSCSALWSLSNLCLKGKIADFFSVIHTKPGHLIIIASLIGGPVSNAAYIIALQTAGSLVIPVSALCIAIGAILGHVFFQRALNQHMVIGILICLSSTLMIASTQFNNSMNNHYLIGFFIALLAAFGWGIEGCLGGYATAIVDYEISIAIRQCISSLGGFILLSTLFAILSKEAFLAPKLLVEALSNIESLVFFFVSSFLAWASCGLWYKSNSMCGPALGMASNGTYAFWGPFFCWLLLGVITNHSGWNLSPMLWSAAILMFIGIFIISYHPTHFFKHKI